MQRIELLAPAGSMEALIAAVQNGCDAVYLGGSMFGARAFANNFDEKELLEALRYAHAYGVKVYVTMNTLLFENEMKDAIQFAQFLYEHDVDALIIQDLGLFDVLHQRFPDLELHASTQMHIHNEQGINFMKEIGMKRVVLPRETPLEEIKQYAKLGIDLEVFVQGALCVSYSGQCLMSAKKLSRSGNRGACAQMCRMKYRLGTYENGSITYVEQAGEYLLSPKDLNTLRKIPALIEAGITSFKIEGRMKRPAYVAQMVSLYRKAIDAYEQGISFMEEHAEEEMRKIFNREFTSGHLFHQKGSALMNPNRPNHMGVKIGTVLGKKGRKVAIRLSATLHQHDGIRFLCPKEDIGCMVNKLYVDGLLRNQAEAGVIVEVEVDGFIPKQVEVVKTSDYEQLEQLKHAYESSMRRVPVYMHITMAIGVPVSLSVWDDAGHHMQVFSDQLVEQARKTPLEESRILQQLRKCKDTIFTVQQIEHSIDPACTISIKALNECRRNALQQLYEARIQIRSKHPYGTYERQLSVSQTSGIYVSVRTMDQYLMAKQNNVAIIFAAPSLYEQLQAQGEQSGYLGKRVMKQPYPIAPVLFQENSGILCPNGYADHFVNVTNSYAAAFLFAHGCKGIILSSECDKNQAAQCKRAFQQRYGCSGNFIHMAYGREELMVMEYCPINYCLKNNDKQACGLCKGTTQYVLEDLNHHVYPLYGDEDCRMHILDETASEDLDLTQAALYLSFYDEDADKLKQLFEGLK